MSTEPTASQTAFRDYRVLFQRCDIEYTKHLEAYTENLSVMRRILASWEQEHNDLRLKETTTPAESTLRKKNFDNKLILLIGYIDWSDGLKRIMIAYENAIKCCFPHTDSHNPLQKAVEDERIIIGCKLISQFTHFQRLLKTAQNIENKLRIALEALAIKCLPTATPAEELNFYYGMTFRVNAAVEKILRDRQNSHDLSWIERNPSTG